MWSHFGPASFTAPLPGIVLYTADTAPGQSGSPVWIQYTNGHRLLVGVHVATNRVLDADTGRSRVTANRAVHLDRDTLALVKTWLPG